MKAATGARYQAPNQPHPDAPGLIQYADDFVVLGTSREPIEQVPNRLAPRGLSLNPDKTRRVPLADGFDVLGFNARRYRTNLWMKPSVAALSRHRRHLRTEVHALRWLNVAQVIDRLNPLIRGSTCYYQSVGSSAAFASLDYDLWPWLYKWATYSHPHKPKRWIVSRYFGSFHPK